MPSTNGTDQTENEQPSPQQQQQQQLTQQQWIQYQQQWMEAMGQYPSAAAAAIAMQQQQQMMMMYQQQYYPYMNQSDPQQYQQQSHYQRSATAAMEEDEVKTIWIGDLQDWMDEAYLHSCFAPSGEVANVKIIRNKQTGQSEGYGFIEFLSRTAAEKALQTYNGSTMPRSEQPFRINWATFSAVEKRSAADSGSDLSIFVGDLAPDVTDVILQETFSRNYQSVIGAKVVVDVNSGRSKGYGFIRFSDENERARAMTEMNGMYCLSRPMRLGVATPKKSAGYQQQQQYPSQAMLLSGGGRSNGSGHQVDQSGNDPNNTTIFVGGIDSETMDADLRQPFSQFGDILNIKIPIGKGCAFVQFATRSEAEAALEGLNGTIIGNHAVRLSWGRNPANRQWRNDQSNQWNNGYDGGNQFYNGYGHPMQQQNQDSSMHNSTAAYDTS